jgi:aquaporin Z
MAAFKTALQQHWPEYLIEAWALGMFMVSAGLCTTLLEYPPSPLHLALPNADVRRVLIGLAMGLTAMALIYSPWGQRSGAHMNPAVTLTFWRLGKVATWDAVFYIVAQCLGGVVGVLLVQSLCGAAFSSAPVNYIATVPGSHGTWVAALAEFTISAVLMSIVLLLANSKVYARFTGLCAGLLVALYISVEAPLSGMSMNPARSLASAWPAGIWTDFWIYLLAPVAGMQCAATWYQRKQQALCAKLLHTNTQRCIHCGYEPAVSNTLVHTSRTQG